MKDWAYVINFDHKQSKEGHWVSLFINRSTAVSFDSFGNLSLITYLKHNLLIMLCVDSTVSLS